MVDLHSHVLYDVDDGSENLDMSMMMIEQSIREGVKILALTPHHIKGLFTDAMDHKNDYAQNLIFCRRNMKERSNWFNHLKS